MSLAELLCPAPGLALHLSFPASHTGKDLGGFPFGPMWGGGAERGQCSIRHQLLASTEETVQWLCKDEPRSPMVTRFRPAAAVATLPSNSQHGP